MLSRAFFTLVVSGVALAASMSPNMGLVSRDDGPQGDADLLSSCPGGPGSSDLERADRCTLINITNNTDVRVWSTLGDPQLNCGGATEDITVALGGSTEVSQSLTASVNIGLDLDVLNIGGGIESSSSNTTTESKTITYSIPPGKQAVYVAGVAHTSQTGNVQVNYGDRQFGHYIWYTVANITRLTPKPSDVQYDVRESDCGANITNVTSPINSTSVSAVPEVEYGSGHFCRIWVYATGVFLLLGGAGYY